MEVDRVGIVGIKDTLGRELREMRISVTDRCNFRCSYCMPLEQYEWIDRREILTFEEITRLAGLFLRSGVEEIRITGGSRCSGTGWTPWFPPSPVSRGSGTFP